MTKHKALLDIKRYVARSQLGTAMDLFIRNKDPISVQVLACGASEILESIVGLNDKKPITTHIIDLHPNLERKSIHAARNVFWNAFKHLKHLKGEIRFEDIETISSFRDEDNDPVLFLAWYDYYLLSSKLPVSAQIFQAWFYALKPSALDANDNATHVILEIFPDLDKQARDEQKRRLRRAIEKYRKIKDITDDARTEPENCGAFRGAFFIPP